MSHGKPMWTKAFPDSRLPLSPSCASPAASAWGPPNLEMTRGAITSPATEMAANCTLSVMIEALRPATSE